MTNKTISFTTPLDRPCVFATFRVEGDVPRVGDKFVRRDNGCWQQEIFTGEFHNFFDDELKAKLEAAYQAALAPKEEKRGPFDYAETTKPFDHIGFIIGYESGELGAEELINGFQQLINSGLAWQLQGCYGRTATALIEAGHCLPASK